MYPSLPSHDSCLGAVPKWISTQSHRTSNLLASMASRSERPATTKMPATKTRTSCCSCYVRTLQLSIVPVLVAAVFSDPATLIVTVVLIFTLYWSIRGLIQLFQRHNSILVIFYLVFLFPIAYCHMLLLGIFGQSKTARAQSAIEQEADKQIKIEAIKASRK